MEVPLHSNSDGNISSTKYGEEFCGYVRYTSMQLEIVGVTFLSAEASLLRENSFVLNNQSLQLLLKIHGIVVFPLTIPVFQFDC